ncbi:hypothetical protein [Fusobacterium sp.]|uniref:Uncharacterized protein n=1 Tax=Fusobacterium nucleatum TaxID=851 RepID=A0A323U042_FUSNU|nr:MULTISPECIES: hypothetical protein [Fusobacterium]PCR86007.1 hypothetical protein CQA79_01270 [Fusobacterium nucleatum]PZA04046.1 hypothetical protein DNF10_08270 [Fusobacterium nucleatum]QJX49889.1 hypothetical protein HOO60_03020 [Fusobacterium nucleatum]HCE32202.1 hypothetical protein [Fusobacterium sp.]
MDIGILKLEDFNFIKVKNEDEVTMKLKDLKELILKYNNEIREILFAVEMERRSKELNKGLNKGLGEEHSLEEMKKMLEEI